MRICNGFFLESLVGHAKVANAFIVARRSSVPACDRSTFAQMPHTDHNTPEPLLPAFEGSRLVQGPRVSHLESGARASIRCQLKIRLPPSLDFP